MSRGWVGEGKPAPEIMVTGGSHGLTVEYRELESVATALEDVVSQLTTLRAGCTEIYLLLSRTSALYANAHQAVGAAEYVIRGLQQNIDELEEAAADLRKAARNYLEVEGDLVRAIPWRLRASMGLSFWGQGGWGVPDRIVTDLAIPERDEILIEAILGFYPGGNPGALRPVDVQKVGGGFETVRMSGTARGMLDRSKVLQDGFDGAGGGETLGPGVVEILTGYRNGKPVRIVTLPGTQMPGAPVAGPNPFDVYGNAEARAEDSRYVAVAVAEALRQAGASAGDAVILVGYSQGGIHAVNTAVRLAEAGEFSLEMVVTAGAPAGDRRTPEGVKVLHFEHRQDWVPGMDGAANPDTPDRTTVTGLGAVEDEGNGGLGPGHNLDVYLNMADQADLSEDPSLKDSLGYLAEIIPPGTIATRSLFRFSRNFGPKPPKPQQSPDPTICLEPIKPPVFLEPIRPPSSPLFSPPLAPPTEAGPQVCRPFLPMPGPAVPLPARPEQ